MYIENPGVVVGRTWGSLPAVDRERWNWLQCDQFQRQLQRARQSAGRKQLASPAGAGSSSNTSLKVGDAAHIPQPQMTLNGTSVAEYFPGVATCWKMYASSPSTVVGQTWGTMPVAMQLVWKDINCDSYGFILRAARRHLGTSGRGIRGPRWPIPRVKNNLYSRSAERRAQQRTCHTAAQIRQGRWVTMGSADSRHHIPCCSDSSRRLACQCRHSLP